MKMGKYSHFHVSYHSESVYNMKRYSLLCLVSMWFLVVYMDVQFVPPFVYKIVFKRSQSSLLIAATIIYNEVIH